MEKNKIFLEHISEDITVKEEITTDPDDDIPASVNHYDNDGNSLLSADFRQNVIKFKTANGNLRHKHKQSKKIAFGDKKKSLARIIKEYPFLWDKNDEFHRNRHKREEAWWRIAQTLNISVLEVKSLWKKLKDTHRYLSSKAKKKIKFNPNDFCDERDYECDITDDLSFLNDNYNCTVREVPSSYGNNTTFQESQSLPDPLNIEDSNFDENNCSFYSYMDAKRAKLPKRAKATNEAPNTFAQITSSNNVAENKKLEIFDSSALKHMHIWMQLEKLFEKLDDDKITDLNFLFVSETYKAILDKRKVQQ